MHIHETSGRMHIGCCRKGVGAHQQAGPCHVESTPTTVTNCLLSLCLSCLLAFSGVWCGDPSGMSSEPHVIRRGRVSMGRAWFTALLVAPRYASPLTPGKAAHFCHPLLSHNALPPPLPRLIACTTSLSSSGNLLVLFYRWLAHLIWLFIHL